MKHIKTFENDKSYNIGDYIMYKIWTTQDDCLEYPAHIYDMSNIHCSIYPYKIEYIDKNKIFKDMCNILDISRYLTEQEIQEYELIENLIKYNL